ARAIGTPGAQSLVVWGMVLRAMNNAAGGMAPPPAVLFPTQCAPCGRKHHSYPCQLWQGAGMRTWICLIVLLLAAPLAGQRTGSADPDTGAEPVNPWNDFEVGGMAEGQFLPLRLGRDRTGLGLRARGGLGFDNNVF